MLTKIFAATCYRAQFAVCSATSIRGLLLVASLQCAWEGRLRAHRKEPCSPSPLLLALVVCLEHGLILFVRTASSTVSPIGDDARVMMLTPLSPLVLLWKRGGDTKATRCGAPPLLDYYHACAARWPPEINYDRDLLLP